MNKETLRMQMLAGVITEGEYVAIVNKEIEEADKASLNESMIGGIVGIGAINQIPPRAKADYEMAFEHFLGERYQVKPNRERDDIKDLEENYRDEEFASDMARNLGYDEPYKNPTTMSPEELQQFKDSAKDKMEEGEDVNRKDNLIKLIATAKLELDKNSKDLDPNSLPELQKTIDMLSAALKATNK